MSTMYRAVLIAQMLGVANAVAVEWKGVFYTPEATYKWGAQKTLGAANNWRYVDATMKMAAIPVVGASETSLANADSVGTTALAGACEEVRDLGTIAPAENKCYTLIFDPLKSQTVYTIDRSAVPAEKDGTAFFLQHLPWEFETTEHYLKDTTGVDIEPVKQDPEPNAGAAAGDGHDHSHGGGDAWNDEYSGKCVCQAQANNWELNCSKMTMIQSAVSALEAGSANGDENNVCLGISPPSSCINNFYIMQAHHDHCLHNQLPIGIEKILHKYEKYYTDCLVQRQFDTSLAAGACAAVTCTDQTSLTNAIQSLQNGDCNSTQKCAASVCSAAIKTVLMAHDTCAESQLPNNLEVALHDFEDACAAELCNSASAVFDPYAQSCEASVSSGAFGLQGPLLIAWALPVFMLTQ